MALEQVVAGLKGRVLKYRRSNDKCPADEFLQGCDQKMRSRFEGSFGGATQVGARYVNNERFKPLSGRGKPLWEFKEFDHRLFCLRRQHGEEVTIVLLGGWVKDKGGRSKEEEREISRALRLADEILAETGGVF